MEIRTTYIGTLKGSHGMWCGFKPKGLVVEEEREVLYPAEGGELENKKTKEKFLSVWLKDGDQQKNYKEVEIK